MDSDDAREAPKPRLHPPATPSNLKPWHPLTHVAHAGAVRTVRIFWFGLFMWGHLVFSFGPWHLFLQLNMCSTISWFLEGRTAVVQIILNPFALGGLSWYSVCGVEPGGSSSPMGHINPAQPKVLTHPGTFLYKPTVSHGLTIKQINRVCDRLIGLLFNGMVNGLQ